MQTVEQTEAVEISDYEKERGKPMPNYTHGMVQANVTAIFFPQVGVEYRIVNELTLELPDGSVVTPDVTVLTRRPVRLGREPAKCHEIPHLVVEILSPSQGYQGVVEKIDGYLANGVKSVWQIDPALKIVAVYQQGSVDPQIVQRGEIKDLATGLSARLEEIFA